MATDLATREGRLILEGNAVTWTRSASGDSDRETTSVWSPYCPLSSSECLSEW